MSGATHEDEDEDDSGHGVQRTIKRYTNRKLYDTSRSSYVTLEEVAEFIRRGEDVRVIDNRSGEDLTSVTLAQIIFEQQKSRRWAMPLTTLRAMIERPSELFQRLSAPVSQLRDEAARQVERLKRRSEGLGDGSALLVEAVETLHSAIADTQQQVDERVQAAVDAVDALAQVPDLKGEIDEIRARLERLEAAVARLSASGSDED